MVIHFWAPLIVLFSSLFWILIQDLIQDFQYGYFNSLRKLFSHCFIKEFSNICRNRDNCIAKPHVIINHHQQLWTHGSCRSGLCIPLRKAWNCFHSILLDLFLSPDWCAKHVITLNTWLWNWIKIQFSKVLRYAASIQLTSRNQFWGRQRVKLFSILKKLNNIHGNSSKKLRTWNNYNLFMYCHWLFNQQTKFSFDTNNRMDT